MSIKKKLLQAAAGQAGGAALNVEQVFSTYLYDGNNSSQPIENGINLGDWAENDTVFHLTGDTLTDSSPFSHTVTAVGNTSVNTSTKKYGTGSIYFDGTGDYLRSTSGRFALGKSDFTIEFWIYLPDASGTKGIFHLWDGSNLSNYSIAMYHGGNDITLNFRDGVNGYTGGTISSTNDNISNNTWHHVAAVRYNDVLNLYIDGTAITSGYDVSAINMVMDDLEIGTHWDSTYTFTGYIDDFRITRGTARYTSNFTPPTAALSLDTSTTGEGGMVWIKSRTSTTTAFIYDTERGATKSLTPSETGAQETDVNTLTAFNSDGFSAGSSSKVNYSLNRYASWTFRKAPKFFDCVTWTGDTVYGREIPHNLGTTVGTIIVKRTDSTDNWYVYHRSLGANKYLRLNLTNAEATYSGVWAGTEPTSTHFTVGSDYLINGSGATYVAYLFAHNNGDGDFGPTGDQDIIKCGSYTGTAGLQNLGWEPQLVLIKRTDSTGDWYILDNMRGVVTSGNDARLLPNTSGAELTGGNLVDFDPLGFRPQGALANISGASYIYIAIRRGPMAVPTDATEVFNVHDEVGEPSTSPLYLGNTDVIDMVLSRNRYKAGGFNFITDRLRGSGTLSYTDNTNAETSGLTYIEFDHNTNNYIAAGGYGNNSGGTSEDSVFWQWKRAPSFFDVVAYTGDGTAGRDIPHNLGVTPEMIWVKKRSSATDSDWAVYHTGLAQPYHYLRLNLSNAYLSDPQAFDSGNHTATTFSVGLNARTNGSSGQTYIAYLFASLDGVSKVGSYTGTGAAQNIDCGFSSGARFVLIKRTNSAGNWNVNDTARGIVAGNDPFLELNTTNAEVSGYDILDPYSAGFTVNSFSGWNALGDSYIFYAIA